MRSTLRSARPASPSVGRSPPVAGGPRTRRRSPAKGGPTTARPTSSASRGRSSTPKRRTCRTSSRPASRPRARARSSRRPTDSCLGRRGRRPRRRGAAARPRAPRGGRPLRGPGTRRYAPPRRRRDARRVGPRRDRARRRGRRRDGRPADGRRSRDGPDRSGHRLARPVRRRGVRPGRCRRRAGDRPPTPRRTPAGSSPAGSARGLRRVPPRCCSSRHATSLTRSLAADGDVDRATLPTARAPGPCGRSGKTGYDLVVAPSPGAAAAAAVDTLAQREAVGRAAKDREALRWVAFGAGFLATTRSSARPPATARRAASSRATPRRRSAPTRRASRSSGASSAWGADRPLRELATPDARALYPRDVAKAGALLDYLLLADADARARVRRGRPRRHRRPCRRDRGGGAGRGIRRRRRTRRGVAAVRGRRLPPPRPRGRGRARGVEGDEVAAGPRAQRGRALRTARTRGRGRALARRAPLPLPYRGRRGRGRARGLAAPVARRASYGRRASCRSGSHARAAAASPRFGSSSRGTGRRWTATAADAWGGSVDGHGLVFLDLDLDGRWGGFGRDGVALDTTFTFPLRRELVLDRKVHEVRRVGPDGREVAWRARPLAAKGEALDALRALERVAPVERAARSRRRTRRSRAHRRRRGRHRRERRRRERRRRERRRRRRPPSPTRRRSPRRSRRGSPIPSRGRACSTPTRARWASRRTARGSSRGSPGRTGRRRSWGRSCSRSRRACPRSPGPATGTTGLPLTFTFESGTDLAALTLAVTLTTEDGTAVPLVRSTSAEARATVIFTPTSRLAPRTTYLWTASWDRRGTDVGRQGVFTTD